MKSDIALKLIKIFTDLKKAAIGEMEKCIPLTMVFKLITVIMK